MFVVISAPIELSSKRLELLDSNSLSAFVSMSLSLCDNMVSLSPTVVSVGENVCSKRQLEPSCELRLSLVI